MMRLFSSIIPTAAIMLLLGCAYAANVHYIPNLNTTEQLTANGTTDIEAGGSYATFNSTGVYFGDDVNVVDTVTASAVNATNVNVTDIAASTVTLGIGSPSAPALMFYDDDVGLYRGENNLLGITAAALSVYDVNVTDDIIVGDNANVTDTVTAASVNATIIRLGNGSSAAPSLTFSSDADTGIFRYAADTVGVADDLYVDDDVTAGGDLAVSGALSVTDYFVATDVNATDDLTVDDDATIVGDVTIGGACYISNDLTTGGDLAISGAGLIADDLSVTDTITTAAVNATITRLGNGSSAAPSATFSSDSDTGVYYHSADKVGVADDLHVDNNLTVGDRVLTAYGDSTLPAYSFSSDSDIGFYRYTGDTIGVAGDLQIDAGDQLLAGQGTEVAPGISFAESDINGFYYIVEDTIGVSGSLSVRGSVSTTNDITAGDDLVAGDDLSVAGDVTVGGAVGVETALYIPSGTPASASATCTAGTIQYDSSYFYVCVATNTWKRASLSSW